MQKKSSQTLRNSRHRERALRAVKIVAYLKRVYPKPKSELRYRTQFQFLVSVILSAQCTDKVVNRVTALLFKKYKTPRDFADAQPFRFQKEISSIPFFRNKTKAIIGSAEKVLSDFGGRIPKNTDDLISLPGVGYKTAQVVLGELYGTYEGIPTDTHVKRFARRFDLSDENDLTKISKDLESLIQKKNWKYVNNGLVLYGRSVCPARPHVCEDHPLTKIWPKSALRWPRAR